MRDDRDTRRPQAAPKPPPLTGADPWCEVVAAPAPAVRSEENMQAKLPIDLTLTVTSYDGATPVTRREVTPAGNGEWPALLGQSRWRVALDVRSAGEGTVDAAATFRLESGAEPCGSVAVALALRQWARDDYLLVPAAVYAANRFNVHSCRYPPSLHAEEGAGPRMPVTITDVPRLAAGDGPSGFHLRSGDMTTPCVAIHSRASSRGLLVLFEPVTAWGLTGLKVTESADRAGLQIGIEAPAVRERMYRMMDSGAQTEDRGASFHAGDTVTLRLRIRTFACPDVPALFDAFFAARTELAGSADLVHGLPLSAAFRIIESKYNGAQWNGSGGYYRVGMSDGPYEDWQAGWVGGGMSSLPLLQEGTPTSRERARKTVDSVFGALQTAGGFIRPIVCRGTARGDDFCHPKRTGVTLIRKQADVLLFAARQALLVRARGESVPAAWLPGLRRLADAVVGLWRRCGQLGQFVDMASGEVLAGGTASGAIAPAGLALSARLLDRPEYLDAAVGIARAFCERHVETGLLNGGPGEILQNADSESAFGMLESLVVLYEETGDRAWIAPAEDAARQCASWCMSYDFPFPAGSAFGQLGMRSLGSVWANVQNKHSAPGICTLSPLSLLKLFRATGDRRYLNLGREISHNVTQYLSRDDRPIPTWDGRVLPAGWMCERVNTSDWEGGRCVGGVFYGSCWCEVSCLLTYTEVPGVWLWTDTGEAVCFDHVEADVADAGDRWVLRLKNPTDFDAEITVLAEPRSAFARPLGEGRVAACPRVAVKSRGRAEMAVAKARSVD